MRLLGDCGRVVVRLYVHRNGVGIEGAKLSSKNGSPMERMGFRKGMGRDQGFSCIRGYDIRRNCGGVRAERLR